VNEHIEFDLYAADDIVVEELPEGNALGTWQTASTGTTMSCPASSASTVATASSSG